MRRLSAIMFTDMVGYSALSQKDEALALRLLEEHRAILRPFFLKYDGREIETAGDSFFVEFNSAVEAANCAIEIQSVLFERNKRHPDREAILLRIGLHIGDVVYMDDKVHGDGVNIAARLEPLAPPGGICISEDVARQIRNKISYPVEKAGAERLKNISMPMDVYCIRLPWISALRSRKKSSARRSTVFYGSLIFIVALTVVLFLVLRNDELRAASPLRNRLAVLPLKNISSLEGDEYFADGLTEELISSIAKIGGLNVIARTSIMKYKETDKDIAQIGKELMVGTVLEGSVRKMKNKARITVQLVNVANQENLWSEDYDRELSDIFSIQSEIATSIAKELRIRLVDSEKQQLEKYGTSNMMAFQEYLIGKHLLNQRTPESIQRSVAHFERSLGYDAEFVLPYPAMAYAYTLVGVAGYGDVGRQVAESKAKQSVMKALELDSTLAEAHAALAYIKFRMDWDWQGAEKEFRKAITLKPGYATAHEWYALFLAVQAKPDDALKEIKIAYDLDPLSPSVNTGYARILHFRGEYDQSLQHIRKTIAMEPEYAEAHFTEGMTYSRINKLKEAESSMLKAIALSGRRPVMLGMLGTVYSRMGKKEDVDKLLKELQTEPVNNDKLFAISTIKTYLDQQDEAFDILDSLVKDKYGILIYMKVERYAFGTSQEKKRYEELLRKMGLL